MEFDIGATLQSVEGWARIGVSIFVAVVIIGMLRLNSKGTNSKKLLEMIGMFILIAFCAFLGLTIGLAESGAGVAENVEAPAEE